jgi:oligoribonuclease NrnB/cAMP/cGMP phosphodiesterase (DHH superfamily)
MEISNIKVYKNCQVGIIYHYPCYDGAYSALNAFLYYKYLLDSQVQFFPSNSHNRISEVDCGKFSTVYILDKGLNEHDWIFIFETLVNYEKSLKIIIIDHHLSSIDYYNKNFKEKFEALDNIEIVFDLMGERSASGLTFDYFKKKAENLGIAQEKIDSIFTENYKIVIIT